MSRHSQISEVRSNNKRGTTDTKTTIPELIGERGREKQQEKELDFSTAASVRAELEKLGVAHDIINATIAQINAGPEK